MGETHSAQLLRAAYSTLFRRSEGPARAGQKNRLGGGVDHTRVFAILAVPGETRSTQLVAVERIELSCSPNQGRPRYKRVPGTSR